MKIAVTGGQGFLGQYVREALLARGHQVMVFDRNPRTEMKSGEEFFLGDIRDETAVNEAVAHCDAVLALAAVLGTQETILNPRPSVEINIGGNLNILQACAQHEAPLVYAGVGNSWMREHGGGAYTITKTCVEDLIKMYNKNRGTSFSVVRPMNAIGPRQSIAAPYGTSRVRKIMPSFVCRALLGHPVELYGGGTQISDCVYATDVADAFVAALEVTASEGPLETAVEVGPVKSHTVRQVAELVINTASSLGYPVSEIVNLPMRPGEVPNATVKAKTSTLNQIGLDARHFVSLEMAVERTVKWYAENWLPLYLGS